MTLWYKLFIAAIIFNLIRGVISRILHCRKIDYKEYLKTPHWRKTRNKALKHYGKHCYLCGSTEHIVIHHNSYKNIGHEKMEDLIPLCNKCHAIYHSSTKSYRGYDKR